MRKKLKDTGGLTMVEMLCAVAILVLLVLMMNTGISMAVKTYQTITAESETELLVSSLTDAITDKLRYTVVYEDASCSIGEIKVSDGTDDYKDADGKTIPEGVVIVQKNEKDESGIIKTTNQRLLPDSAYGTSKGGGYIEEYKVEKVGEDGSKEPLVTYHPDTNSFTVTFNVTAPKAHITKEANFTVRCLSPVKTIETEEVGSP